MSWRRKWIAVGVVVGLVGVGVGIYFAWGAKLETEYERRVEALREGGDYLDEPRSWYAQVPANENAAVVLADAAELLEKLQEDDEELREVLAQFTLGGWDSESLVAEDQERLRQHWPKLDGYFAKLEAAGARPVLAWPRPKGEAPLGVIQDVSDLLQIRARIHPEMAPDSVRLLMNLADRWRPAGSLEMRIRFTVRGVALEVLHVGLRDGTLDVSAHREAWDRQLARWDPIPALRDILRHTRMDGVRFFDQLRDGVDPYAEARKEFEEEFGEEFGEEPLFREMFELPWYARWYGRPVLHREALKMLDEAEFALAHATSEASLREALRAEHSKGTGPGERIPWAYARTLEHTAEVRLARIAMAIQVDAKAHGRPRKSLDALPNDPFTGRPFRCERHADRVVLSCSIGVPGEGEWESLRAALHKSWLFEELVVWEVRWAPAGQAD
jgi:hypothetical protein